MTAGRLTHQMRMQAAFRERAIGRPKQGLVSSYDPENYLVKVRLQPEDVETGWLPIQTLQAGAGWGIYAAPAIGDQAIVLFLEGDLEVGWCAGFLPSDEDQPPSVPSGEMHLIHTAGQFLKLLTDGTAEIVGKAATQFVKLNPDGSITVSTGSGGNLASATFRPDGTIASTGAWTHTGTLHVTDEVTADKSVTATVDVVGGGKHLKTHTHNGVTPGGGVSGPPT